MVIVHEEKKRKPKQKFIIDLKKLGYVYDENKRCYYTDGYERADVVKDRDEQYLDSYFTIELCTHRWVQIPESKAIEFETLHNDFQFFL